VPNTFWGLVTAAVVVSVAHAALPSHWLPFALVGRTQGWSARRVVSVTATAGLGHVAMTSLLGLLVAAVGMGLLQAVGEWSQPLTAGVLFATGGVYLVWTWRGGAGHLLLHQHASPPGPEPPHPHSHEPGHPHNHDCANQIPNVRALSLPAEGSLPAPQGLPSRAAGAPFPRAALSDRAAFWSLFSLLTFSPCEGMVPFFFASARFGWAGLLVLAAVTGALTVLGMLLLVGLTQAGLERVRWPLSERGEKGLTGGVLLALGAAVLVWP